MSHQDVSQVGALARLTKGSRPMALVEIVPKAGTKALGGCVSLHIS